MIHKEQVSDGNFYYVSFREYRRNKPFDHEFCPVYMNVNYSNIRNHFLLISLILRLVAYFIKSE